MASARFAAASRRLRESVRASAETEELARAGKLIELLFHLVAMNEQLVGGRAVLPQELLQAEPAVLDLDEARRARLDVLGIARERPRRVRELGARRLDGARDGRERLVDRGGGIEVGRDARELIADRAFAFVEAVGSALSGGLELLRVTKTSALALEVRLLAGRGVELLDLLQPHARLDRAPPRARG
jgi:hypothetical protein